MAKGILIHNGSVIEGNATPSDVLSGKTFMSENSDDVQTGTLSLTGNASANDVRSGKTFYNTSAKTKQTGSLNTKKTITISVDHSWGSAQGYNRITFSGPFGSKTYDAGFPTGQSHRDMGSFSFDVEI